MKEAERSQRFNYIVLIWYDLFTSQSCTKLLFDRGEGSMLSWVLRKTKVSSSILYSTAFRGYFCVENYNVLVFMEILSSKSITVLPVVRNVLCSSVYRKNSNSTEMMITFTLESIVVSWTRRLQIVLFLLYHFLVSFYRPIFTICQAILRSI